MMLSLIVPTRARQDSLRRLTRSLTATTADRANLELVLVIDEDDFTYDDMTFDGLNTVMHRVPPGQTMSDLNMAGYRACSGDCIMLMNDDVVVQTRDWDKIVRNVFDDHPDGIVLVHVNDTLFGSRLCTFPLLTRSFCTIAAGICPSGYRRYRIDDHIHNVFNRLSVLGHNRIIYLPEVVFEHLNVDIDHPVNPGYQFDAVIHELDSRLYDATLRDRQVLARQLADTIRLYRMSERFAELRVALSTYDNGSRSDPRDPSKLSCRSQRLETSQWRSNMRPLS